MYKILDWGSGWHHEKQLLRMNRVAAIEHRRSSKCPAVDSRESNYLRSLDLREDRGTLFVSGEEELENSLRSQLRLL